MGTQTSIKLGLQEGLQGSTQIQAVDGEESIVLSEARPEQIPSVEVQGQEITKANASGKSEAGEEKSSIPSRERYEVVSICVQEQTSDVDGNEAGSQHKTTIEEHVSARGDDIASLGDGTDAVLKPKVEAAQHDLGNAMDLCQTSTLAACRTNLSTTSFSIESHRQSSCDQIYFPGIAEEATSTQNGGLLVKEIIREDKQLALVDVRPLLPCIYKNNERNLQANAPRESDPGDFQKLVVGSQGDCNGMKKSMSIEIVNPSVRDVGSDELKIRGAVNLEVDVSPAYREEQGNDILQATPTGTSSEAGAREDISIISRELSGNQQAKIKIQG